MKRSFLFFMFFAAIFMTFECPGEDETEEPSAQCKLDNSILESEAEAYFSFKGRGIINSSEDDPAFADAVTATLVGIEGKTLSYSSKYSYFSIESLNGMEDVLTLWVYGDANMAKGYFGTIVVAMIPLEYIDFMQSEELDRLPLAPIIQIIDMVYSLDGKYVKQCMAATNKNGEMNEYGTTAIGAFQICSDQNQGISEGAEIKLAVLAELATGEEILENFDDVETMDDLCSCYNKNDYTETDCSAVKWDEEKNDDKDTSDTDDKTDSGSDDSSDQSDSDSSDDEEDDDYEEEDDDEPDNDITENSDEEPGKKEEKKSDGCSMLFV